MRHHQLKKHLNHLKTRLFSPIVIVIFVVSFLYPFSYIFAALSCSVVSQSTCTGTGGTTLLRMSGNTNAHAELPSQSNANYAANVVCCTSPSAIGNSCSGNFKVFTRLSAVTNAHVQETTASVPYSNNACLSDTSPGDTITVGYQNSNCTGYDTTLFSMVPGTGFTDTNATVGDGSAYTRKVCATITPQVLTFDLDTAADFSNGESNAPYSVPLGTLSSGSVTVSDTSSVRMIVAEGDTNAVGGMVVTVQSVNGANGLVSTSVPADKIPNAAGTMSAGTANYGLCVASSGLTGFTRATAYNTTCALSSGTNTIPALTTTPTDILNTGGTAVTGAHAEIVVNSAISTVTPAHTDYTDTVTFIVTGTF